MVIKLNEIDQSVFCGDHSVMFPVKNAWGKQGWTIIELKKIRKALFNDALNTAYSTVAATLSQKKKSPVKKKTASKKRP